MRWATSTCQNAYYDQDSKTTAADIGLRTRFKTGSVGHTVALGVNYLEPGDGVFLRNLGHAATRRICTTPRRCRR
jgi:iron complex outermembrane receptor protein